jgi:ribosomal protein S12 methylthiotransferase accessory factor
MELSKSPKIYNDYKCDFPENTIKRIKDGFNKIGLTITYDEREIHRVDSSIFIGKACINTLCWDQFGKGTTRKLAKAGAYAELAERFSTGYTKIIIPLSLNDQKYQNLLNNINEKSFLKGFTNKNNLKLEDEYELINSYFIRNISKENYELFEKEELVDSYADAFSLISKKYKKIPISLIELISMSNGLASGNTIEEAIAQASFEIFERHASYKILSEKFVCPTIDTGSISDKKNLKYIDFFDSFGIDVIIKDFTLNNTIPTIAVLFIDKSLENEKNKLKKYRFYKRLSIGSHLDLNEAIMRCFNENIQVLQCDDNLTPKKEFDILWNMWTKNLNKKYYGPDIKEKYFSRTGDYYGDLSFLERGEKILFDGLKSKKNTDCLEDIESIIKICKKNDWDFLVVDYTHKILNFPTVRVIIPPISVEHDRFTSQIFTIKDFDERVTKFYGIKDFIYYLQKDDWLKDKDKIKNLIQNIENYISKELDQYDFTMIRENNYEQSINLFHILALLYMSINKYELAKKYLETLLELDFKKQKKSPYLDSLYNMKYNPNIYKTYIELINNHLDGKNHFEFKLKTNPFDPESGTIEFNNICLSLLKNINNSFN